MRSDFLDRVGEDPLFLEELSRGLVFLSAPDRQGLREAIVAPLEMVGYELESDNMLDHMLDELEGTPGALPLLQFTAAKLWDLRDRERKALTVASYEQIGGMTGALATHADEVVRNMNANAQRLTQKVFRQLVTPDRTRAIVELSELYQLSTDRAEITRVIDLLVAARLLVVQTRADAGGGSVEIVHESLLDRWPMLRRWLDEDQEDAAYLQDLAAAAKQWDAKGRPAGLLWSGDAMLEARRWYTSRPRVLPPREQAFIDAVLAHARSAIRTRRILLTLAFSILAVFGAVAGVGYLRVKSAEEQATEALAIAKADRDKAQTALAARDAADAERAKAVGEKQTALSEAERAKQLAEEEERKKLEAQAGEQLTREQLIEKNALLQQSLADQKAARDKAEAASKEAKAAAAEAQRLQKELQVKLDEEKARVKQLQEEMKKISTKLKDF
jgi:hypothetical protein